MADHNTTDVEMNRTGAVDVEEGDRVFLGISFHGSHEDAVYATDVHQTGVFGVVTDAPNDRERELMEDDGRPMVDFRVKTSDDVVFTWNVDNGYVIGPHAGLGRRTDVGRFGGFYTEA